MIFYKINGQGYLILDPDHGQLVCGRNALFATVDPANNSLSLVNSTNLTGWYIDTFAGCIFNGSGDIVYATDPIICTAH